MPKICVFLFVVGKLKENHYFLRGPFGILVFVWKTEGKSLVSEGPLWMGLVGVLTELD